MAQPVAPTFWTILLLSALAFLAAAKTHGRQIRLERQSRGHLDVQFGTGTNPPFVEGLGRRDRIRFWSLLSILILTVLVLTLSGIVPAHAMPLHDAADEPRL